MTSVSDAIKTKRQAQNKLLSIPGVHALAVGSKSTGGKDQYKIVIKVFVDKKRNKGNIPENEVIPEEINGVSTDVEERPRYGVAHSGQQIDYDKTTYPDGFLRGGINVGNKIETGTLTAIVYDDNNQFYILGSRHVFAPFKAWSQTDPVYHISESENIVATLQDAELYEQDHKDESFIIDAAVARINEPNLSKFKCDIFEIGSITGVMHESELRDKWEANKTGRGPPIHVQKRGITTRKTSGTIESIDYGPHSVCYGILDSALNCVASGGRIGWVTFPHSLLEIVSDSGDKFSSPGDSGACIVEDSNAPNYRVVGSILAGIGIDGRRTAANHIDPVCERFHVKFC